jgi:hypothetical protein
LNSPNSSAAFSLDSSHASTPGDCTFTGVIIEAAQARQFGDPIVASRTL